MLRMCYWAAYKQYIFPLFILFIIIFLNASNVSAVVATLSWYAPTANSDGTILTNLAGYKIYYGMSSRNYSQVIDVGNVTTYTVTNLTGGITYYFAATAYNIFGIESAYSNEVSKTADPTLTINKAGTGVGTVTSSSAGINCGTACTGSFKKGTVLNLVAAPDSQSTFYGWTSGGCSGTGICLLNLNTDSFVTATFNILPIPPIADFYASPTSGALPLYVSFTDASANRPNVWSWSFGDGGASSLQNPGYTYKEAGAYTISLTVSNANGTDIETKTSYIIVSPCQNQSTRIRRTPTIYYSTIQAAYDAALDSDIIELHAADFAENLSFNRNIVVTLQGGYDCGYTSIPADSSIIGMTELLDGTVIFNNITMQ